MKSLKARLVHIFIVSIFCSLYFLVATISMINSVEFFDLAHSGAMSWSLAIGFELGAAASLAAIIILEKTNRLMVWFLFLLLTAFQMMANSFHAFEHLENYFGWIELFGLEEEEPLFQKRLLSIVSGAVLPIVALGFIKSLTDYIKVEPAPKENTKEEADNYYESRNKKIEDIVEKKRRAENFKNAIISTNTANSELDKQSTGIDAVEEIRKEFEKQATPFDPNAIIPEPTSNELEVHVDEKTGTTFVKTKGITPPVPAPVPAPVTPPIPSPKKSNPL